MHSHSPVLNKVHLGILQGDFWITSGGTTDIPQITEPKFVNIYGAQESIPDGLVRQIGLSYGPAKALFVNLLRSPGINSKHGGPVRQPYLTYRPARLHRLAISIPWNRLLGSLKIYKYELRLHIGWRNLLLGIDSWAS